MELQRAYATIGRTYLVQGEATKDGVATSRESASSILRQAQQALQKGLEISDRIRGQIDTQEYAGMKARLYLNLGQYLAILKL